MENPPLLWAVLYIRISSHFHRAKDNFALCSTVIGGKFANISLSSILFRHKCELVFFQQIQSGKCVQGSVYYFVIPFSDDPLFGDLV